jgi:hypothetical protein
MRSAPGPKPTWINGGSHCHQFGISPADQHCQRTCVIGIATEIGIQVDEDHPNTMPTRWCRGKSGDVKDTGDRLAQGMRQAMPTLKRQVPYKAVIAGRHGHVRGRDSSGGRVAQVNAPPPRAMPGSAEL